MSRRFIFWQNINSIHQSAFLKALSKSHEVILVTSDSGTERERMGWSEPALPGIRHVRMREGGWESLLRNREGEEDCHVFAGLHAFPGVHAAFRRAVALRCRIGIYSEPLVRQGAVGWLKDLRGRFDSLRYSDAIDFVLCIGEEARRQFRAWGFPKHRLHSWAYVTEDMGQQPDVIPSDEKLRCVFPASLIPRKGADILLLALSLMRHRNAIHVDAFSVDPDAMDDWQKALKIEADRSGVMSVRPYISNDELLRRLPAYDLMLLPSRHDGWGAAVNESLMAGVPVLASDRCGSSSLLRGRTFLGQAVPPDPKRLAECLDAIVEKGRPRPEVRARIRDWALQHISGEALSRYFLSIADGSSSALAFDATAPWERQDTRVELPSPKILV
ncbi:MAG: glycosyltransferase [Chitinophagia bacterium]|nr:glycosyltransferase [Chitinophagia bacterium]